MSERLVRWLSVIMANGLVSGLQSPGGYCTNILSLSLFSLYICHLSYSDIKLKHSYWLGFSMKKIMHDKH